MYIALFLAISSILVSPANIDHNIQVVDYEGFEQYLDKYGDKTVVVNFWATWCIPCVAELPYFEEANAHYDDEEVAFLLVSLDFENQIEKRVIPFIEKKNLTSKVIVLDDPDANAWIDKVSPEWSGAIPATLVKKGDMKAFYERSFHSTEELKHIIQPFLKS